MRNVRSPATATMEKYPLTAQRQSLLDIIHQAGGHIDAKQLYQLASNGDHPISLATVYRSLRVFKELGLVEERRLGHLHCCYEAKQPSEHQHLVCKGCGDVIEFTSPQICKLISEVRREHNFNVTKAELYFEGYCQKCQPEWLREDSKGQ